MQTDAFGNLRQQIALPAQFENLVMLRRARRQHLPPEIVGDGDFARPRLIRGRMSIVQRLLALCRSPMLPDAIDEPIARGDIEKAAQMVDVRKPAARLAKRSDHIGPDRLQYVGRIEFRGNIGGSCRRTARRKYGSNSTNTCPAAASSPAHSLPNS